MKLALVVAVLLSAFAHAQIPIPNHYDGFALGDVNSPILFEAFFDLLCPDCAAAWPNIKDVLNYYNPSGQASKLRFLLHTFPLPYHHNAFYASQGAHIVDASSDSLWSYVDSMFENQATFWDGATDGITPNQVRQNMATLVESKTGFPQKSFINGLSNDTLNMDTRVSWKYGCSRGVAWTPAFFVNGISVLADPSWTLSDWRMLLDPLLSGNAAPIELPTVVPGHLGKCSRAVLAERARRTLHASFLPSTPNDCPSGEVPCTYKPGKTVCCLKGENCIPNVGCRC